MRKTITILLFSIISVGGFAQIPDWAINLPKSNNPTMDYLVGIGEGNTYKNAYNEAVCDALRKLILRFGLSVNSNDVMSAVYNGQELTTISRDYNIPPINNVCVSQVKQQGLERVYVLFQIPANAMITNPVFESFTKCDNEQMALDAFKQYDISYSEFRFNEKKNIYDDNPTISWILEKSDNTKFAGDMLWTFPPLVGLGVGMGVGLGLADQPTLQLIIIPLNSAD